MVDNRKFNQGQSIALSANANIIVIGGNTDDSNIGIYINKEIR
jgi:hypothetical protein